MDKNQFKIVILSDNFPPYAPGGAEQSTFGLAQAFKKKGHQVFVVTTCREKSAEENLDYQGLKVFRIYSNYHDRWRAYLSLYNPQTVGKVKKLLEAIRPDIVLANNIHWYLSYFCLKLARKYAKGVFLTIRDTMSVYYGKWQPEKPNDFKITALDRFRSAGMRYNPFREMAVRHYLKYTDKIFAISNSLKKFLEVNGIKNIETIYNGIDVIDWQENSAETQNLKEKYNLFGKKVILFGGRIGEAKGSMVALKALKRIVESVPEAILLVVGQENQYTRGMKEMAEFWRISSNLVFAGWLERKDMRSAFFASDVCITPSIYLDPFNLFNIEAMAARKPVVGTRFGGTPEIVQDGKTGFIVNPYHTTEMAEKIIELLKNPQKAKQFGEAGYLRVKEKFNLEKQADKYLECFRSSLNRGNL